MKKNILFTTLAAAVIVACSILLGDGLIYLAASLMGFTILGLLHYNRSRVMKMTRWAKANPKKTQGVIAGLQLTLMALGVMAGYNLKKLGYEFSDATGYVFSIIMVIGFLSVPFKPKRNTLTLPQEVSKYRLAYLGITLSSLIMFTLTGNKIEDVYPNSPITHVIKTIDQSIFPDDIPDVNDDAIGQVNPNEQQQDLANGSLAFPVFAAIKTNGNETSNHLVFSDKNTSHKSLKKAAKAKKKAERKAKKMERKLKRLAATGACIGAVLLIIFVLVPFLCGGICLLIFGLSGDIAAGYALLGALLAAGSIWGIIEVVKWCAEDSN